MADGTNGHYADDAGHTNGSGTRRSLELKRGGFLASYPPFETLQAGDTQDVWQNRRLAVYAHLPYCRKRCTFCFYKVYTNQAAKPMDPYLDALHKELDLYGARPELQGRPVHAIYYGGGTPTRLSIPQMRALTNRIRRNFNVLPDAEFTSESEPGTLDARKLAAMREMGVTRLSMGVQTFDDDLLKKNGRSHGSHQVFKALELARQNDFPVINIDLMSGIVDETMPTWEKSVQTLIDLNIEHVSIYRMEVYKNTLLYAAGYTGPGVGGIPTDEEELELWLRAVDMLEGAGYTQVTGHAFIKRPEHNHVERDIMWGGEDFIATGLSSYSYLNDTVFQNTASWDKYVAAAGSGKSPVEKLVKLNSRQRMARDVVLGLKTLHFDRPAFRKRHGFDVLDLYGPQVEVLVENGLLEVHDEEITVTRRGRVYVEIIGSMFYLPEHSSLAFHRFATEDELTRTGVLQVGELPIAKPSGLARELELTAV